MLQAFGDEAGSAHKPHAEAVSTPTGQSRPIHGRVTAVSRSAAHTFSKLNQHSIRLLAGLGAEGDAHLGETVKHRSRVARDPSQPNLRQVYLIHAELHDELQAAGFAVSAGKLGENVTTRGIDLLALPPGTRLHIGETAVVEVTGLRNPCVQLDRFQPGLMAAVLGRDEKGKLIRKAGIMGIVLAGGEVRPGDPHRAAIGAATAARAGLRRTERRGSRAATRTVVGVRGGGAGVAIRDRAGARLRITAAR